MAKCREIFPDLLSKRDMRDAVDKPNVKTVNNQTKYPINSCNDAIKIKLMYFKNFAEIYIQIVFPIIPVILTQDLLPYLNNVGKQSYSVEFTKQNCPM